MTRFERRCLAHLMEAVAEILPGLEDGPKKQVLRSNAHLLIVTGSDQDDDDIVAE